MKRINIKLYGFLALLSLLIACEKSENTAAGNPVIDLKTEFASALFGDSLNFEIGVSDADVPLSTVKVQLFYTDDMVQETVIRTKENGTYSGKIWIPFYKDVPNGVATIKVVLQNINKTITEESHDLSLSRPNFPYLTLVSESREYRMEKVADNEYVASENFPFSVKAYIKAPKVGNQGNEMTFGYEGTSVVYGSIANIPFSNSSSGVYNISFNTLNYSASPFIIAYAVNGTVMNRTNDELFYVDVNLTKDQEVVIDGIEDLSDWWIDSDFITNDGTSLKFAAMTGKYRITADFAKKYFVVEAMLGNSLATLQADGTGAIWIIGEGVGKPSLANAVGWTTEKALCLAPIGGKKYQITVKAGETINATNINFKFFHQKNWGGEFSGTTLTTTSDVILIGNGNNGRDSGNLGFVSGKSLTAGKTYVFTVDLSAGNDKAVLAVVEK
ncbi:DUF5125 domain-containing protein [Sphingobacterium hungaricum]|uniref:DUF5125 domain-containing protein n=1 Tax=Sphingobacterium hungaricum TaxID=2082723 RepID=A0A928V0W4_9SPHI|nr:DUF5125 domain-containing protein [Sphingobacterium hungaricum]MBE8714109.1 hypothetical protein [Sphingobacterium hungaricum]